MCPSSILVTKKGTWKLAGFEFIGNVTTYFCNSFFTWFDKRFHVSHYTREMPWIWRGGTCCLSTMEHKIVENGSTKSWLYGWVERKKLYPPSGERKNLFQILILHTNDFQTERNFLFLRAFLHFTFSFSLFKRKIYWHLNCEVHHNSQTTNKYAVNSSVKITRTDCDMFYVCHQFTCLRICLL